jgi:hypothetical protein
VRSSRASQAASVSAIAVRVSCNCANCASISVSRRRPAARTEWQGGRPLSRALRKPASSFDVKNESDGVPNEQEAGDGVFGVAPKPARRPRCARQRADALVISD